MKNQSLLSDSNNNGIIGTGHYEQLSGARSTPELLSRSFPFSSALHFNFNTHNSKSLSPSPPQLSFEETWIVVNFRSAVYWGLEMSMNHSPEVDIACLMDRRCRTD
ncbi:Hypothetical protein NTJ_07303 [Nesidiocoris tenuis]|uniref:Uncharacterized protein n=1 Tax=Nesidiocoris tenuis TaxID=355587 RepID=A0ABN7AQK7_9HEMI|nr:Hypothetical protein NTJ_07303 [Nesidiocoris tenuis]